MADDKLRSLELVEKLIEMASKSPAFWRNFGRIVLPAKDLQALLERLVEELPVDITKAKEMLIERDRFMEEAVARSEKIVDDAAEEAGKLLDDSEITARAKKTSAKLRAEADQYVIETLEKLEDTMAGLLTNIKTAQSELINSMERRREDELKRVDKD